jgi:predicted deacylase
MVLLGIAIGLPAEAQTRPDPAVYREAPALPVTEITGAAPGPTVAFVAGVHGGKVAAIHALDSLRQLLATRIVRGRVLLVGPANLAGYRAGLAQTSPDDSLNLNRVFPGRVDGRPTERLAARVMHEIVARSDYLIDLHGSDGDEAVGRFAYAARPGVDARVDSAARELAFAWQTPVVVWDDAGPRTLAESRFLQTAAHLSGVPAITVFEAGDTRVDACATAAFVGGALRVLNRLGLLARDGAESEPPRCVVPRETASSAATATAVTTRVLARRAVMTASADGQWRPTTAPGVLLAPGEPAGWLRSSSGSETAVPMPDGGLVLHLRKAGPVRAGTPLAITGIAPAP